ncbi:uncharacterized protein LOC141719153 [Apium graveolens]|uniref:uncharacterized protein LOC141719153 n=1 Tax=Apium graveolens TaxID=4045 RepID=UPI003D7BEECF
MNSIRNERNCQFFRPNSKDWDVHKVQQNFHDGDIQLILQKRIPQSNIRDRIAWMGSCNGEYTVKSSYRYWASQSTSTASVNVSKGWNKIWQVQLPHKQSGLDIDFSDVEIAPNWLLDKFSNGDLELVEKIGTVLWGIWFSRNKRVWEGKNISPGVAMNISTKMMVDWREADKKKMLSHPETAQAPPSSCTQWSLPEVGWYKVNVDASVYTNDTTFALGMILRNDHGQFMLGKI